MSNETELVVVEPKSVLTAFSSKNGLSEVIDSAVMEVKNFKHDMSTKAGRDKTRSLARKVASLKTTLDGMGKDLVSEWKTQSKAVDENRKQMRDELDELKIEARKPLTEFEAIEQARKDKHLTTITLIELLGQNQSPEGEAVELAQLKTNLDELNGIVVDESFQEYELSATKNKAKSLEQLEFYIASEEKRNEEAAELERLRAAEEERVQKERDEQLQKEAADKARIEAEAVAKQAEVAAKEESERVARERDAAIQAKADAEAAAKQAERDKIAAEENAKLEAKVAAERAKQEEIKRQEDEIKAAKAAQAKKEANNAHVGKIRGAAKKSLMKFVDEETAKKIVLAIHAGEIKNVTINY